MKSCEQAQGHSVFDHGTSVNEYMKDLVSYMETKTSTKCWRIPDWIDQFGDMILSNLLPENIRSQYAILHDCGKPFCLEVDSDGRRHFPNHAKKSEETYLSLFDSPSDDDILISKLIGRDMDVHLMKAEDIPAFCADPRQAITLLLTGLAEIHSNASMFGGIESQSFKIKWKQLDKRGRAICKLIGGER